MRTRHWPSILLALTCLVASVRTALPEEQPRATIVLLHRRGARCFDDAVDETISAAALQREQSAQWATEIINNQTAAHMLSIGIEVADTCGSASATEFRARQIVNQTQVTPIIGVIALEDPQVLNDAAALLRRHRIPLVVATPKASEALFYSNQSTTSQSLGPSNVFSAVPNSASIARATMAVAKGIHSPSIRILSTCSRTLEAARKAARQLRIRTVSSEYWSMEHSSTLSYVESLSLGPNSAPPVVALLMEPAEMQTFMNEALTQRAARHVTWLLGCLGTIGPQVAAQWTMSLSNSAFLIEPHAPELAGLSQFLESKGLYSQPIENEVPHIVQAISALGAAFHLQELDNCYSSGVGGTNVTCRPLRLTNPSSLPADMLNALRKISLPKTEDASGLSSDEVARELEGTSNHFTSSGRLVANRYLIQKLVAGTGESSPVAWYSDDEGLVLAIQSNERFYFFSSPGPPLAPVQSFLLAEEHEDSPVEEFVEQELKPTVDHAALPTDSAVLDNHLDTQEDSLDDISSHLLVTSTPHQSRSLLLQGRTWAAAIVALAATEFLAAVYILGLLVLRWYQGVSQGPQAFDLLLLLSLIGQLMTVVLFVLPVSLTVHELKLFLPPVLLVLSYTILLIKLMQTAGPTPQCHFYLILLLAVAVQTAVSCHFYSQQVDLYVPECNLTQFLLLYSFLVALVAMTTGHAIYLRHQCRSVLITSSLSTASVAVWILCCTWTHAELRDAATAVLIVVLSAVVLGANFIPKVAQVNQLQRQAEGKVGQPWQPHLSLPSDKFAASQLSGSALMRHPAYIGRNGI